MRNERFQTRKSDRLFDTSATPLVQVKKEIHAPVERVFEACSRPDIMKEWWGPESFSAPVIKMNFKEGGKYLFCMRSPEGERIWSTGEFETIVPNRRIVMSDSPANARGEILEGEQAAEVNGPFPDEGPGYITLEFATSGEGQTLLFLSHAGLPARMHDECVDGWSSSLEKLKDFVEHH